MAPLTMQELDDLSSAMLERMGQELLPALTRANRMGDLEALLETLGMSDLLEGGGEPNPLEIGKIIVLGGSKVPVDRLRKVAKNAGFDPDRFEFQTDYKRLQHFNFGKIRGSMGYIAIFAGPMPHSTPGSAEASSFIARVESNRNDYPELFKLGTPNELKITRNSFEDGLKRLEAFIGQSAA